jgi:hypothetical protein
MENLGIFLTIWSITAVGNIYGHLVYFVAIWYIFTRFGILYQDKSGNPAVCHVLLPTALRRRSDEFLNGCSKQQSFTYLIFIRIDFFTE